MKSPDSVTSLKSAFFLSFLLGFIIRLIPELLSYPNLIGFDTIEYAARLKEGIIWYHWSNIFSQAWLLYSLIIPFHGITHLNPTLILKITSPIIYGLNAAGIYYFAVKGLGWKPKKSLLASALFSFSIASLRISWDLYRNILGLGILLFTISIMPEVEKGKKIPHFMLLSALTVFSHELTAVTLIAISAWTIMNKIRDSERNKALRLLVSLLPSLVTFSARIFLTLYPISYKVETNIISIGDMNFARSFGFFFFITNYLKVSTPWGQYSTYIELTVHILSLFALLYLIWIPFIIKGFFREKTLDPWSILLLTGSFNALVTPFAALLDWERWMFMLIYPFTFYATNGVEKILGNGNRNQLRQTEALIALTIIMGILFISLPTAFPIPTTVTYFPTSMQQNTIPLEDVNGTIECIEWLNTNMNQNSAVIVHHAFLYWTKLYLDNNRTIIYYAMNLTKAIEVAQQNGFKEIYLIWWSQNIGWYPDISIPRTFKLTYTQNRIGTYTLEKD